MTSAPSSQNPVTFNDTDIVRFLNQESDADTKTKIFLKLNKNGTLEAKSMSDKGVGWFEKMRMKRHSKEYNLSKIIEKCATLEISDDRSCKVMEKLVEKAVKYNTNARTRWIPFRKLISNDALKDMQHNIFTYKNSKRKGVSAEIEPNPTKSVQTPASIKAHEHKESAKVTVTNPLDKVLVDIDAEKLCKLIQSKENTLDAVKYVVSKLPEKLKTSEIMLRLQGYTEPYDSNYQAKMIAFLSALPKDEIEKGTSKEDNILLRASSIHGSPIQAKIVEYVLLKKEISSDKIAQLIKTDPKGILKNIAQSVEFKTLQSRLENDCKLDLQALWKDTLTNNHLLPELLFRSNPRLKDCSDFIFSLTFTDAEWKSVLLKTATKSHKDSAFFEAARASQEDLFKTVLSKLEKSVSGDDWIPILTTDDPLSGIYFVAFESPTLWASGKSFLETMKDKLSPDSIKNYFTKSVKDPDFALYKSFKRLAAFIGKKEEPIMRERLKNLVDFMRESDLKPEDWKNALDIELPSTFDTSIKTFADLLKYVDEKAPAGAEKFLPLITALSHPLKVETKSSVATTGVSAFDWAEYEKSAEYGLLTTSYKLTPEELKTRQGLLTAFIMNPTTSSEDVKKLLKKLMSDKNIDSKLLSRETFLKILEENKSNRDNANKIFMALRTIPNPIMGTDLFSLLKKGIAEEVIIDCIDFFPREEINSLKLISEGSLLDVARKQKMTKVVAHLESKMTSKYFIGF